MTYFLNDTPAWTNAKGQQDLLGLADLKRMRTLLEELKKPIELPSSEALPLGDTFVTIKECSYLPKTVKDANGKDVELLGVVVSPPLFQLDGTPNPAKIVMLVADR